MFDNAGPLSLLMWTFLCLSLQPQKGWAVQARGRGVCVLPGGQNRPAAAVHYKLFAGDVLPRVLGCVLERGGQTDRPLLPAGERLLAVARRSVSVSYAGRLRSI